MKLGLIVPSDDNPYASTLLAALLAAGDRPAGVLCSHRSALSRAIACARTQGIGAMLRRIRSRYDPTGTVKDEVRRCLARFASDQKLANWNRRISATCRQLGIPYLRAAGVNDPAAVAFAQGLDLDLLLSTAGDIYRAGMLAAPQIGILNAHMALLPEFRGMNVLEWSVFCGRPIGVTVHFDAPKIDAGDIVVARELLIKPGDTLATLRARSLTLNVTLMLEAVRLLRADATGCRRPGDGPGRQYFVMHHRLRAIVERRVQRLAGSYSAR